MSLESSVAELVNQASELISTFEGKKQEIESAMQDAFSGAIKTNNNSVTYTVGPGGDYETINQAIIAVYHQRPMYKNSQDPSRVILNLLSGFVAQEQILVNYGVDLSFINITSQDSEVMVDSDYLTTTFSGERPFMGALRGATLPEVSVLFDMIGSNKASDHIGVLLKRSSTFLAQGGGGVKNAGGHGLSVSTSSMAVCGTNADFSGAGGYGVYANQGGQVGCDWANLTTCATGGIYAAFGSVVVMNSANAIMDSEGVESSSDITAIYGSTIVANGSSGGLNQAANTLTSNGIIYK